MSGQSTSVPNKSPTLPHTIPTAQTATGQTGYSVFDNLRESLGSRKANQAGGLNPNQVLPHEINQEHFVGQTLGVNPSKPQPQVTTPGPTQHHNLPHKLGLSWASLLQPNVAVNVQLKYTKHDRS